MGAFPVANLLESICRTAVEIDRGLTQLSHTLLGAALSGVDQDTKLPRARSTTEQMIGSHNVRIGEGVTAPFVL